jgi:hypothetical protein
VPPNGFYVVRKRAQPNFCPDRAAVESNASLHSGNIQPKPKMSGGQNRRRFKRAV